jgi:hypothetical protein
MSDKQTFDLTPVAVLGRWKRYLLSVSAFLAMECVQAIAWQISWLTMGWTEESHFDF